jgi:nucleoside-diphosphate-sugar epimerase
MIVAITGGTGFIGKRLVLRHLMEGNTVRVLTRRSANDTGADLLYHCAAEINRPDLMQKVHVQGTRNLIEAANGKVGRWIQLSSVGVYGSNLNSIVTEDTLLNPVGIYETTKAESDNLVIEAAARGAITFSMLRPSNVFGEEMTNRSLYQLISIIDKGLFFFVGKPGASANYIYIDNVIEGLIRCGKLSEAKGRIYNLSDWKSMEEFVSVISAELGKPTPRLRIPEGLSRFIALFSSALPGIPITSSRVDAFTNRCIYATDRIEKELQYKHLVPMERGLIRLIKAWKSSIIK